MANKIFLTIFCALVGFGSTLFYLERNIAGMQNKAEVIIDSTQQNFIVYVKPATPLPTLSKVQVGPNLWNVRDKVGMAYHQNPTFLVWAMLMLIMLTIASGSFPFFIAQIFETSRNFHLSLFQWGLSLVSAVGLIIVVASFPGSQPGLYKVNDFIRDGRILLLNADVLATLVRVTIGLVFPIVLLIFLIIPAIGKINTSPGSTDEAEREAFRIGALNSTLGNGLQILAIVIVFSVLTSSTLKDSVKQVITIVPDKKFDIIPNQLSFLYGLCFSLFLAILYFPVYFFLKYRSVQLRNFLLFKKEYDKEWKDKAFSVMNMEKSGLDNLKLALTVLSPLITAFLPGQKF